MASRQSGSPGGRGWDEHPPDRRQYGQDGDGGRRASGSILLLVPIACLVVLAGALVAGLSLDAGRLPGGSTWELRAKVVALSGLFGGGAAPAFGLAGALLAALILGRSDDGGHGLGAIVCVAAGWLAAVTALSIAVDVSLLTGDDLGVGGTGYLIGQLLGDIGLLTIAGTTVALAVRR